MRILSYFSFETKAKLERKNKRLAWILKGKTSLKRAVIFALDHGYDYNNYNSVIEIPENKLNDIVIDFPLDYLETAQKNSENIEKLFEYPPPIIPNFDGSLEHFHIAVCGINKTGKSSLVRMMLFQLSEAHVNTPSLNHMPIKVNQPTKKPGRYSITDRLFLTDIPGRETRNTEDYVRENHLLWYHYVVIVSDTVFTEEDIKLAQLLKTERRKFCFIRTKIDLVAQKSVDRHRPVKNRRRMLQKQPMRRVNSEKIIHEVLESARTQLKQVIQNSPINLSEIPLFSVHCNDENAYEFQQFLDELEPYLEEPSKLKSDNTLFESFWQTSNEIKIVKQSRKQSQYHGVVWNRVRQCWAAHRKIFGMDVHGGFFENEIEAANAADKIIIEYQRQHGECPEKINFTEADRSVQNGTAFSRTRVQSVHEMDRAIERSLAEQIRGIQAFNPPSYEDAITSIEGSPPAATSPISAPRTGSLTPRAVSFQAVSPASSPQQINDLEVLSGAELPPTPENETNDNVGELVPPIADPNEDQEWFYIKGALDGLKLSNREKSVEFERKLKEQQFQVSFVMELEPADLVEVIGFTKLQAIVFLKKLKEILQGSGY